MRGRDVAARPHRLRRGAAGVDERGGCVAVTSRHGRMGFAVEFRVSTRVADA